MTFDDIHSGTLVLPWYGIGERVFYFEHAGLALVDHKGTHFHCKLTFGVDRAGEMCCKVSNGIETTIDYPLTDGSRIPLYISQRYFVAHG
ncbi:hypothetical protein P8452_22532 [Trifolium repens]|nr:hypothetical protein P8452_22532 [Trifolium repens]